MKKGFLNTTKGRRAIAVGPSQEVVTLTNGKPIDFHSPSMICNQSTDEAKVPSTVSTVQEPYIVEKYEHGIVEDTRKSTLPCRISSHSHYLTLELPAGYIRPVLKLKTISSHKLSSVVETTEGTRYIFSAQPPIPLEATLADLPDGWTECMFVPKVQYIILNTVGFSTPMKRLTRPRYRLGAIPSKGTGMFALTDLQANETILWERPLLICPVGVDQRGLDVGHGSDNWTLPECRMALLDVAEGYMEIIVGRMDPENQEAYKALANSHLQDGSPPLIGIVRTNCLAVSGLTDPDLLDYPSAQYVAVCKVASRVNHRSVCTDITHISLADASKLSL